MTTTILEDDEEDHDMMTYNYYFKYKKNLYVLHLM